MALSACALPAVVAALAGAWTPPRHTALDYLLHFEDLPYFYSGTLTEQVSSRDPSGGNSDGFNCDRWAYETAGEYVIFDAAGPGCIEDIWMTNPPSGKIRIYFDNESTPRVDLDTQTFFSGGSAPFLFPLCGNDEVSSGGFYCKVPLAFAQRARIAFTGKPCYWHVLWHRYPPGTPVQTFTAELDVAAAVALFSAAGNDPKPAAGNQAATGTVRLPPGETHTLFAESGAGAIMALLLDPTPASEDVLRRTWLRITFDGAEHPQVRAPLGLFFLCGLGETDVRALPLGMRADGPYYCYFPMPYWQSVEVALENASGESVTVPYEIHRNPAPYGEDAGYFCARHKRESPTTNGVDYLYLETCGTGHLVGTSMLFAAQDTEPHFLEGDERFYIDGAQAPLVYGTGTEDYIEGGWFFNRGAFALPTHGLARRVDEGLWKRFSMYRFHLADRIPFTSRILAGIEHGEINNRVATYESVAYYYWKPYPTAFLCDELDVGTDESEAAHAYVVSGETWNGFLWAQYEGDRDDLSLRDVGRRFGTASEFVLNVPSPSVGLLLRRRMDHSAGRQTGSVRIDGVPFALWQTPDLNTLKKWHDTWLYVPRDPTAPRSPISVRIQSANWTEFHYWAHSLADVERLWTWEAEALVPAGSSGESYSPAARLDLNWTWGGDAVGVFASNAPGDWIRFEVPVEAGGWYGAWVVLDRGDDYGICRVAMGNEAPGDPVDLYDTEYRRGPLATTGVLLPLAPGPCSVRVEVVDRNLLSSGYRIGIDSIHLARVSAPGSPPPSGATIQLR